MKENPAGVPYSEAVEAVRSYYNSDDARRVYETAYGDEHLHLGIYENDDDTIDEAGQRTMERMASMVRQLGPDTRVLDIGSGHGGSARYLFHHYGCHVACLNLNARRDFNAAASAPGQMWWTGFEDIPFTDEASTWWVHLSATAATGIRGSRPGPVRRQFIFTAPCKSCVDLQPILDRVSTPWDPFYAVRAGWSSSSTSAASHHPLWTRSTKCAPMSRIC